MLLPGCLTCRQHVAYRHGNCNRCLAWHVQAIKQGNTTWAQLEAQGLAQPVGKTGAKWMIGFRRLLAGGKGK
jgi:hypothetical protein